MVRDGGWASYVAVGDSFTEGMNDVLPDGSYRGWADLVAEALAEHRPAGEFRYANLAVRGKLFDPIVEDQVPAVMRLHPDLVTFAAGGNDALRRKVDLPRLLRRFEEIVRMLRATGADVVLFRFADISRRLPGQRIMLPRIQVMNRAVGEVAERYGAHLVDMFDDRTFDDPRLWSDDRLHLNEAGHRRVAAKVLAALGAPAEAAWAADLPAAAPEAWLARRRADARWVRTHLGPWVHRRLTGRSSGDGRLPKRPDLIPWTPLEQSEA